MERYHVVKVLLVSNSPGTALLAEEALGDSTRFPLTHVSRLSDARQQLDQTKDKIILLDLGLSSIQAFSDTRGLEILRELKESVREIPIIALTDNNDEQLALDAIRQGAQECLVKNQLQGGSLRRTIRHILERDRMEKSLRDSEQKLQAIINTTPLCIKLLNPAGEVLQMNLAGLRILDATSAANVLGKCAFDLIAPEDRHRFHAFHDSIIRGAQGRLEFDMISLKGARRTLQTDSVPLVSPDGTILHLAITQDITKPKAAAAELFLRERAIQGVSQGILITDALQPDDPVIYTNPGFEKMTGYTAAEILGRNCRMMQGPDSDPAAIEKMHHAVAARRSCTVEILNYRKDGTTFWNAISIAPIVEEDGAIKYMVGLMNDVTEWRMMEGQLRHAQKMEAIGQLAGCVAHDFNNLLTIILGSCDELQTADTPPAASVGAIHHIQQAAQRAGALTRQLLAFSRKQMLKPMVLNLNEILTNVLTMASRLLGENIKLRTALLPSLWPVKLDQGQIEQVILNLVVNARDAMPAGGQLSIETANVEWSEDDCRFVPERRPGCYVMLGIRDTGTGIAPTVKPRIFEPFFTTKESGKGTGLGLSVVYGIVKQSEGYIEVESAVEQGTAFLLYFPAVKERVDKETAAQTLLPLQSGTETILLVEDEEGVRNIVRLALEKQGYQLIVATNGQDALNALETHRDKLDLLLTDVVLPVMSGRQLSKTLTARYPEMKVIYMTGYPDNVAMTQGLGNEQQTLLQKPFSMLELLRKVHNVLQG